MTVDSPDAVGPKMLVAQILLVQGKQDEAMRHLRDLTQALPETLAAWQLLQTVQMRMGDLAGARETIDAGLVHLPENADLLQSKAFVSERQGDVDGAIAIYEMLYAADSNNLLTANNLGSLLASTRTDPESIERAWIVSRRLAGNPLPAFQDTVGWISFLRGDMKTAIENLQSAANGLPGDPTVAYHLGRAYAATEQHDAAMAEYARAQALVAQGVTAYPAFTADLEKAQGALNK